MNQIHAFLPTIRFLQVLSLCPFSVDKHFQPKLSQRLKFYCLGWMIVSVTGLLPLYYKSEIYVSGEKSDVGTTVDYIQLIGMRLSHIIILIEVLVNEKILIKFFSNLCEIDENINKVGAVIDFVKEKRKSTQRLFLALLFYVGVSLLHLTVVFLRSQFGLITNYWLSYFIPYVISCFRYFQIFNLVSFIHKRIAILNDKLAELDMKAEEEEPIQLPTGFKLYTTDNKFKSRPPTIKNFEQLNLFRETYDKLYVLSTIVNYSFGLSTLVNIGNDFVSITSNTYFMFIRLQKVALDLDDILRIMETIFWCLPHFVNVLVIVALCHSTVQTVRRFI